MIFWGLSNAVANVLPNGIGTEISSNGGLAILNGLDISRYIIWSKAFENFGLWCESPPKKYILLSTRTELCP